MIPVYTSIFLLMTIYFQVERSNSGPYFGRKSPFSTYAVRLRPNGGFVLSITFERGGLYGKNKPAGRPQSSQFPSGIRGDE